MAVATPTKATAALRRVLDAAPPAGSAAAGRLPDGTHPNPHTLEAYKWALAAFLTYLDAEQIGMRQAKPYDIRQYLETMASCYQPGTSNQHMAAIRGFYQYLRERTDFDSNPAAEVRGQRTGDRQGKTPYLPSSATQRLIDSLPGDLDTWLLFDTDGMTWKSRLADLRKIIERQNQEKIARIYTTRMRDEFLADLKSLKQIIG